MKTLRFFVIAILTTTSASVIAQENNEFKPLFNGKDLEGWQQLGGTAKYRVVDDAIVGESVPNTPNSFLCTQKLYRNFVLEYEYKCDNLLNSGVQFRSNAYPIDVFFQNGKKKRKVAAGRVHGYQVEIDPNKPDRMWSGGIYDEGRRGWLFPGAQGGDAAAFTKAGQSAYKPDEWNKVRVECKGNRIRTWLNDVPRADFEDKLTSHGFIALQVHGVGKHKEAIGKTVAWRKLQIKELP